MAQIRPFRAMRYNTDRQRDVSALIAPPYDVLSQDQRDVLAARDPHNIVRLDLPHMPPASLGPPEAYTRSAELIEKWLEQKVLIRDDQPALYYYQQTFEIGTTTYARNAFFARIRLEPLGKGAIMPHEQTFSGPKEDRLALTKATRCNLSQVLGLYPDPQNQILETLKPNSSEPDCFAELEGIRSKLWLIRDARKIKRVAELMADKKIYIADGHHRYGTSLNYKRFLTESGQTLDDEHPANFISMVLVSASDPGLLILPTHRLVRNLPNDFADRLRADTTKQLNWIATDLGPDQAGQLTALIAAKHPQALGFYDPHPARLFLLIPRSEDILAPYSPDSSPALRTLPVAILHKYLLAEKLSPLVTAGSELEITYVKDTAEAINLCRQGQHQAAFLLQPTTIAQMLSVIQSGQLMPPKSTYFYPKVPTGLIINPLY